MSLRLAGEGRHPGPQRHGLVGPGLGAPGVAALALAGEASRRKAEPSPRCPIVALCAAAILAPLPSLAEGERAGALGAQCAETVGLTAGECTCVIETARADLSQRQVDYLLVRVARDEAEVQRMRQFMGLFERLAILTTVLDAADICAPGKPIALPES